MQQKTAKYILFINTSILRRRKHLSDVELFWTVRSEELIQTVRILHITKCDFDVEGYKSLFHNLFSSSAPDFWLWRVNYSAEHMQQNRLHTS